MLSLLALCLRTYKQVKKTDTSLIPFDTHCLPILANGQNLRNYTSLATTADISGGQPWTTSCRPMMNDVALFGQFVLGASATAKENF